jgi:hypothetical protein
LKFIIIIIIISFLGAPRQWDLISGIFVDYEQFEYFRKFQNLNYHIYTILRKTILSNSISDTVYILMDFWCKKIESCGIFKKKEVKFQFVLHYYILFYKYPIMFIFIIIFIHKLNDFKVYKSTKNSGEKEAPLLPGIQYWHFRQ